MKIAALLLCHEPPSQVVKRLSSPFFASPDLKVYLHYDAKRSDVAFERLKSGAPTNVQLQILDQRVAGAWGEYSLVEATHRLIKHATNDPDFQADYLVLLSGSCMPIRPLASLQEYLRRRDGIDFIQAVDISQRSWVKDGLERERFQYYFPFNFQQQRKLFETATNWQRRWGISRKAPENLRIHFGSQWFALTRATASEVAARLDEPSLKDFFAKSWIPDEFAIQTLVASIQRPAFLAGHNLTYYEFDDQGRPLVLENGHFEHLMRQPFFFARKVAADATALIAQVDQHVAGAARDLSFSSHAGSATNDYQRFLARSMTLRPARAHVGTVEDPWRGPMDFSKRRYHVLYASSARYLAHLLAAARETSQLPIFDFLFDPVQLVPAAGQGAWRGIQSGMRARRDYDPGAFLHEIVNIDPQQPTAFAIHPAIDCWARSFVVWDPNATLICCDPPHLSYEQRAEAGLREMGSASDAKLMRQTLSAVAGRKWTPLEHFGEALAEHKHSCQMINLFDIPAAAGDETLLALKLAAGQVDVWQYHASATEAEVRIRELQPSTA